MVAYLIAGILLLIGAVFLVRWFINANPGNVAHQLKWVAGGIIAAVAIFLLVTGRFSQAIYLLFLILPLLVRWRALFTMMKNAAGPSAGQTSEVRTEYVRMTLDHDTGDMSGTVLRGAHQGRRLEELAEHEVMELLRECRIEDSESAKVIEAWLDRTHGPDWRTGDDGAGAEQQSAGRSGASAMTRDEAYEILGLQPGASRDDIEAAYRRLMSKIHPDHGGSDYLAAKINQAKEILLGA